MKTHTLPALGALWPEQGGHFAGITRNKDDKTVAIIVPPRGIAELGKHEWGAYGKLIEDADHRTDGVANANRLIGAALANFPAAHAVAASNRAGGINGHLDWYLPSIGELQLAAMHCAEQFEDKTGWYWSSTQLGRYTAWLVDFEYGGSHDTTKGSYFKVRPFRRLEI